MATFKITITADKYPTEYAVSCGSWPTAIGRAVRDWKKSAGKGSRTQTMSIRAVKITNLDILKTK